MNTNTVKHTHWQIAPDGVESVVGEADLHQCIRNILSTRKGQDVLRPECGSDHFDYIDQPYDMALPNMVREIFIAIQRWESRIVLQDVTVSGTAPHFTFLLQWVVAEDIARQIYSTEFSQ